MQNHVAKVLGMPRGKPGSKAVRMEHKTFRVLAPMMESHKYLEREVNTKNKLIEALQDEVKNTNEAFDLFAKHLAQYGYEHDPDNPCAMWAFIAKKFHQIHPPDNDVVSIKQEQMAKPLSNEEEERSNASPGHLPSLRP